MLVELSVVEQRYQAVMEVISGVHLVEAVVTAAQAGRVEAMTNRNSHRLRAI